MFSKCGFLLLQYIVYFKKYNLYFPDYNIVPAMNIIANFEERDRCMSKSR